MFGIVGYAIGCFAVACALTVVVAMFRPIKQNDDWKAWKWIVGFMITLAAIPYCYVEGLTLMFGKPMVNGVKEAIDESNMKGDLIYFRVVRCSEEKAHVLAVAADANEFGWPERAVIEMDLAKTKGDWHADAYSIVNSFHRQRDSSTTPPYW